MTSSNPWVLYPKPKPNADLRLFCFPYAGGGAQIYREWPEGLPSNVEVCPIQLPGRGNRMREVPYTKLLDLVESLSPAIVPSLDRPFAFFGHSMGAEIAYELSRLLSKQHGLEPAHLFVSGSIAPHIPDDRPPNYHLPGPEFTAEVRRLNGTPAEVLEHPELMQILIPLLRADFELVQTHKYVEGPPLSCPLTAFGGLRDQYVSPEAIEGWRQHTTGSFSARMLPGDHFFVATSQKLLHRIIAQELYKVIEATIRL
jgi:medium-chain acyl-[acyl-carrier-protein] hydrolase